ncbi:MAG: SDR family oxidoreductase [Betaproteobacteria bacterium]|nr:SDR family oxidoreductase [Betaproteobacteria bacterium]
MSGVMVITGGGRSGVEAMSAARLQRIFATNLLGAFLCAREAAEEGIRVNCVRPGFVHTDLDASGGEPNRIERLHAGIPMKRGGEPEEVARAVLWLLSQEASCTGAILDVTGGR